MEPFGFKSKRFSDGQNTLSFRGVNCFYEDIAVSGGNGEVRMLVLHFGLERESEDGKKRFSCAGYYKVLYRSDFLVTVGVPESV